MTPPSASAQAHVRVLAPNRFVYWLLSGWKDFVRAPALGAAQGLALCGFGLLMLIGLNQHFWLLAGAFSGFLIIAPVLVSCMYALSRALERGEPVSLGLLVRTWTGWQGSRNSDPDAYWSLVRFGLLLALAGTGWVLTSAAFITLFAPVPVNNLMDFFRTIALSKDNHLLEVWITVGGMLSAPMFASSVVTMPLLLDRKISVWQAVLCSWQVVLSNPVLMALWALCIALLTLAAFASALMGLIIVVPVLGHASWHAYRELVDVRELAPR